MNRSFPYQLGVALGFFLPPMMVQDHENVDDIGADLKRMFYIVAGVCTAFFLLVLVGNAFLKIEIWVYINRFGK